MNQENTSRKPDASLQEIRALLSELHDALAQRNLVKFRQGVADIQRAATCSGEVLIRVQATLLEEALTHKKYNRISGLLERIESALSKSEAMFNSSTHKSGKSQEDSFNENKFIGTYLVEAELITPLQAQIALVDQQATGIRFGEILVSRGWVKQGTIEYIMQKVVLPERETKDAPVSAKSGQGQTTAKPPSQARKSHLQVERSREAPVPTGLSAKETLIID